MTTSNNNSLVEQKLNEFELLETIHASAAWEKELFAKINAPQVTSRKPFPSAGYTLMITVLIMINVGVLFNHFKGDKKHLNRTAEYQLLVNQLLVGEGDN